MHTWANGLLKFSPTTDWSRSDFDYVKGRTRQIVNITKVIPFVQERIQALLSLHLPTKNNFQWQIIFWLFLHNVPKVSPNTPKFHWKIIFSDFSSNQTTNEFSLYLLVLYRTHSPTKVILEIKTWPQIQGLLKESNF